MAQRSEYFVWTGMHRRCNSRKHWAYKYYGGRGIRVCKRWSGPDGFANFLVDMGQRPKGPFRQVTLHRVNNNRNYSPSNCIWLLKYKDQLIGKSSHGWNRLTYQQAMEIRNDPRRPYRVIAADYGVTRHMIGMIIRGDVWKKDYGWGH